MAFKEQADIDVVSQGFLLLLWYVLLLLFLIIELRHLLANGVRLERSMRSRLSRVLQEVLLRSLPRLRRLLYVHDLIEVD